jgi:hypothetical protein
MHLKKILTIVTAIVVGAGLALLLVAGAAAKTEEGFLLLLWPTKDSVRVGEEFDFEGIVVNSSVTTLEDVMILNSIPAHTRFVTVTGDGFFPIRNFLPRHTSIFPMQIPRATAGDGVVAIGWTGDVEPGMQGMITFCLTLEVVSVDPTDLVITDTVLVYQGGELTASTASSVTVEALYYLYLPLTARNH